MIFACVIIFYLCRGYRKTVEILFASETNEENLKSLLRLVMLPEKPAFRPSLVICFDYTQLIKYYAMFLVGRIL